MVRSVVSGHGLRNRLRFEKATTAGPEWLCRTSFMVLGFNHGSECCVWTRSQGSIVIRESLDGGAGVASSNFNLGFGI